MSELSIYQGARINVCGYLNTSASFITGADRNG